MNPGEVDIVVYPPLSVEDWTLEDLSDRIEGVRQLYLDTLKNWPTDEVPVPDIYKKASAKKAAKNAPAKKTPAKKTAAKKAPAKKAAAKKATDAKGRR
jgi:putative phosphoserine phosphatase/1-acylglycerol-3-phosphate O-acyltransferase